MSERQQWLKGLKPGDRVMVNHLIYHGCIPSIFEVDARKGCRIVCGGFEFSSISGGMMRSSAEIAPVDMKHIAKIRREIKTRRIRNMIQRPRWDRVSDATARKVYRLLVADGAVDEVES